MVHLELEDGMGFWLGVQVARNVFPVLCLLFLCVASARSSSDSFSALKLPKFQNIDQYLYGAGFAVNVIIGVYNVYQFYINYARVQDKPDDTKDEEGGVASDSLTAYGGSSNSLDAGELQARKDWKRYRNFSQTVHGCVASIRKKRFLLTHSRPATSWFNYLQRKSELKKGRKRMQLAITLFVTSTGPLAFRDPHFTIPAAFSMGVVLALEFNFLETIEINRTVLELLYLRALAEGMDFELVRSTLTSAGLSKGDVLTEFGENQIFLTLFLYVMHIIGRIQWFAGRSTGFVVPKYHLLNNILSFIASLLAFVLDLSTSIVLAHLCVSAPPGVYASVVVRIIIMLFVTFPTLIYDFSCVRIESTIRKFSLGLFGILVAIIFPFWPVIYAGLGGAGGELAEIASNEPGSNFSTVILEVCDGDSLAVDSIITPETAAIFYSIAEILLGVVWFMALAFRLIRADARYLRLEVKDTARSL
mmetsp:Transcript_17725/g.23206  ORF Transcript_17725/g.23206 Transcript_17725/m.23206 type:complete len:475 (-) Transcript_17725:472-1896(-)